MARTARTAPKNDTDAYDQHIRALVATAPPLSERQKDRLRPLLTGSDSARDGEPKAS